VEAAVERAPDPASTAPRHIGRVLLLEDDASFREIITECLTDNGYTVVAVQNGADGIREVLAGDFTVVVCDFMMPALAGDIFYRAVEKIRPALCQRFVFMTGHQNEERTTDFVKKTNVFMLRKPFPLESLLDSIAVAEACCMFQSVLECKKAEPAGSQAGGRAREFVDGEPVRRDAPDLPGKMDAIPSRAQGAQRPGVQSDAVTESKPVRRGRGAEFATVFAGVALLLAAAAGLWNQYQGAQERVAAVAAERQALDGEWAGISPHLEEAISVRSQNEANQGQLARLSADRAKPRWAPALRCIVPPGDVKIEILDVYARGKTEDSGACEVRVHGVAGGAESRLTADRFRQAFEGSLKMTVPGRPVSARFEQLEDASSALPDKTEARFVVTATVGSIAPPVAASKGVR
jgi:CheY-like chemotaxis protein